MTVEYLVLGVILIIMGVAQAWLRHGPGARRLREEEQRARGARPGQSVSRGGVRSGRAWEAWTAILGLVGIAVGVLLVVLGALGR